MCTYAPDKTLVRKQWVFQMPHLFGIQHSGKKVMIILKIMGTGVDSTVSSCQTVYLYSVN